MIEDYSGILKGIFVGRKSELANFWNLWNACTKVPGENLVYTLLNAPGVGKTALMKKFPEKLEERGEEFIWVNFTVERGVKTLGGMIKGQVRALDLALENYNFEGKIKDRFKKSFQGVTLETRMRKIDRLLREIQDTLEKDEVDINTVDFTVLLKQVALYVPVYLTIDEIQVLEGMVAYRDEKQKRDITLFYLLTEAFSSLINSKIFVVLSGTQYHLLSRIGADIGSPIRNKVEQIVISPLSKENIEDYVAEVKKKFKSDFSSYEPFKVEQFFKVYCRFLLAYSGGHSRTVHRISSYFIRFMEDIIKSGDIINFESFVGKHFHLVRDYAHEQVQAQKIDAINELARVKGFEEVRRWIASQILYDKSLGEFPGERTQQVIHVLNELVRIGILIINSRNRYYLASHFHGQLFFDALDDEHSRFISEILNNEMVKELCGGHGGFGFLFEHVVYACLLGKSFKQVKDEIIVDGMKLERSKISGLRTFTGKNIPGFEDIEPNYLYYTPLAKGVDFIILLNTGDGGEKVVLLVMQLTSGDPPDNSKIQELASFASKVAASLPARAELKSWFISLLPVKIPTGQDLSNVTITAGDSLAAIIGKDVHNRLVVLKRGVFE
ncbi:MAG: hypothetical protein ACTSUE_11805 [Promethearchaeota archaeon]